MVKRLLFVLLIGLMCGTTILTAQNIKPVMEFESMEHDFGTFKEDGGRVTHDFVFVNKGDQPIIINNVKTSCGCTKPEWSKEPVAPGKKGVVKAIYDPKNRPSSFNKTITVTANTQKPVHILRIKGNVTPREKTVAELYPHQMDDLRLESNHFSLTRVINTEVKESSLPVINTSDKPITVTFSRVPAHITLKTVPAVLKPQEKGNIVAVYDAGKKKDWGFVTDYIYVKINDKENRRNRLTVSADIVEDFSGLTAEQKSMSPQLQFDNKVFDFGKITQGEKAEHVFVLSNVGKSDLFIRKTKASCGCTAISPEKKVLKPGEQSELKVVFNSRGKTGRQHKTVTIITNDPNESNVRLRIIGDVVLPETK